MIKLEIFSIINLMDAKVTCRDLPAPAAAGGAERGDRRATRYNSGSCFSFFFYFF
jgi:hypothetical protein